MAIYDSDATEYLQVICEPCGQNGLVFAEVGGLTCPKCGNPPTQVCYADPDAINAGV